MVLLDGLIFQQTPHCFCLRHVRDGRVIVGQDLLRDWGAAIPPDAPEPTRKDDEEACENDTELVDPDQDPAQPMGAPADSELT